MNVNYSYKINSLLESLRTNNRYGSYPIGKFNAWHGGAHIEGDVNVKTIADGRIIAYRMATKNLTEDIGLGDKNPKYSNGFVVVQHDYKSPKGLEFTFYSLYNHLLVKEDYLIDENTKKKIPDALAEKKYKISDKAKSSINGLEVYNLNADGKTLDTKNPIFLEYKTKVTKSKENGKVVAVKITGKTSKYHKIDCVDFKGKTHKGVYANSSYITIDNKVKNAEKYKKDNKIFLGAIVYEKAESTASKKNILGKGTAIKINNVKSSGDWLALTDDGFIRKNNAVFTKEIKTEGIVFDKVVKCDIPIKGGVAIGNTGLFGSGVVKDYQTAHVEVFSFDDPKKFLEGGDDAKDEENKKYLKIPKDTELTQNVTASISIVKNTPVKVLAIANDYCQIEIVSPQAEVLNKYLDHSEYSKHKHYKIKADFKETKKVTVTQSKFVDGIIVEEEKEVNKTTDIECLKEIKNKFKTSKPTYHEYLTKDSKLSYVSGQKTLKRVVSFKPKNVGIKFWVKSTEVQKKGGGTFTKNEYLVLQKEITEYYVIKPVKTPKKLKTEEQLPKKESDITKVSSLDKKKHWYCFEVNGEKGLLKTDDKKITKVAAFNWLEFGFNPLEAGEEYCYSVADVQKGIDNSDPFIEEIWKTLDQDQDKILDEKELDNAKRNPKIREKLSKLICKHKSEWSYTEAEIAQEAEEFYKIGIAKATGDYKKALEDKKGKNISNLKERAKNLTFWDKIENGEVDNTKDTSWFSYLRALSFVPLYLMKKTYESLTDDGIRVRGEEKATPKKETKSKKDRIFKTSQKNVWHFHPHAFVEQMNRIAGNKLIFPFKSIPFNHPDGFKDKSYNWWDYNKHESSPPTFGYKRGRPSIRLHAARDLYSKVGEPVYAIADGTVKKIYEFYYDTYAIEIEHEYEYKKGYKLYVRYGEVSKKNIKVKVGQKVTQGHEIAQVGLLYNIKKVKEKDRYVYQPPGEKRGMLHLEMYTGEAKGVLKDKKIKYEDMLYATSDKYHSGRSFQRRKDLFDPLPLLKEMYLNSKNMKLF